MNRHLLIVTGIVICSLGCSAEHREETGSVAGSEPPILSQEKSEEAQQLLKELEEFSADAEKNLEEAAQRSLEKRGGIPSGLATKKFPKQRRPRPKPSASFGETCTPHADQFPVFSLAIDESGKAVQCVLKTSSGHPACDDLALEFLQKVSWDPCDPETTDLTCTFDYVFAYPSRLHMGLPPKLPQSAENES